MIDHETQLDKVEKSRVEEQSFIQHLEEQVYTVCNRRIEDAINEVVKKRNHEFQSRVKSYMKTLANTTESEREELMKIQGSTEEIKPIKFSIRNIIRVIFKTGLDRK